MLSVDVDQVEVVREALAQTAVGVRINKPSEYKTAYRAAVAAAQNTYLDGNPPKACADIYDQVESITKTFAINTYNQKLWYTGTGKNKTAYKGAAPKLTDSWF